MKKFLVAMMVAVMMCVSAVAMAAPSNGSLLNDEEKISTSMFNAFTGKGEYATAVSPYITKGLAKNFSRSKLTETQKKMTEAFGTMKNFKLMGLQKFDKADRVFFRADASKVPAVELVFTFDTTGKVLLDAFALRPIEIKK